MSRILVVCLAVFAASSLFANEFPDYHYDLDHEIHAKFIFVGFPVASEVPDYPFDPCYPVNVSGTSIFESIHLQIVEQIRSYLHQHSNGTLRLADDSGILHRFAERDGFDVDNADSNEVLTAWTAEYEPCQYMPDKVFDSSYPYYAETHEWWADGDCSELSAEILWKIYNEYWIEPGALDRVNPFERADGEEWSLFFIFLKEGADCPDWGSWPPGPWGAGVGGKPGIFLDASAVVDSTGSFYSTIMQGDDETFDGSCQAGWTFCNGTNSVDAAEANARAILHEFVHTLGITDGLPNLLNDVLNSNTYYYGYLHLECQHYEFGEGIPPLADPALQTLPWNRGRANDQPESVVDLSDSNVRGFKLFDVRAGGQIAKISLGLYPYGACEEYFVLAYHAGTGLDDQRRGVDPGPIVPSQGVAIWHCLGDERPEMGTTDPFVYDLESAMGKWNYGYPRVVLEFVPPLGADAPPGLQEDPESGYDNYDCWPTVDDPSPGDTNDWRRDYGRYWGDVFDFFRSDLTDEDGAPEDSLSKYNRSEFSFRTNPNTFGYSREYAQAHELRRLPQNVPNSIVVRIGETVFDPVDGDYVLIDYSPGPWAGVVAPAAGETIASGAGFDITWSDDYAEFITAVDIEYSRNKGQSWTPLIQGYIPQQNEHNWTWAVPDSAASVAAGESYLRITFHNSISDAVAIETMPAGFTVSGTPHQAEEIVYPGSGDRLYQGLADTLRWTHDVPGPWQFELVWRHDGGPEQFSGQLLDFTLDPATDEYWALWTPEIEHVGPEVQLRLECFSHALETVSGVWTPAFSIYPLGAAFGDSTQAVLADPDSWYEGIPSGAIPVDFNADGLEDFIVTMEEDWNDEKKGVYAYENETGIGGMRFSYRDADALFGFDPPEPTASSATAGDLDGDGDRDLVVGLAKDVVGSEAREARLYRNDGASGYTDVTALWTDSSPDLLRVSHAAIVDYNHDGYEDLFLAAAPDVQGPGGDRLWKNLAGSSGGETRFEMRTVDWNATASSKTSAWSLGTGPDLRWRVLVHDRYATAPRYFEEDRDGSFVEFPSSLPALPQPVASCWADIDHQHDLDLVVATKHHGLVIVWGRRDGDDRFIDGSTTVELPWGWRPSGIAAVDHDMDGWVDLVVSGAGETNDTLVLMNLLGHDAFAEPFVVVDGRAGVAVDGIATAASLAAADYDGDRDYDLMVSRTDPAGRVYDSATNTSLPDVGWIAFAFSSSTATSTMGSVIILMHDGQEIGRQLLDGGRGESGQHSGLVIMGVPGLGSEDVIDYIIHLPTGDAEGSASPGETVPVVLTPPALAVDEASVTGKVTVVPDAGLIEWRFTWITNRWTPPGNDVVHLYKTPKVDDNECAFASELLTVTSPDTKVRVTYQVDDATGIRSYLHEVIWTDQPCVVNCNYSFTVSSATMEEPELVVGTQTATTGKIKVCPQTY